MNKTTEALKLAEEALQTPFNDIAYLLNSEKALAAIREALADHIADTGKMVAEADALEALREMVSAQHAGPITSEMFAAWKKGKSIIDKADKSASVAEPVKQEPVAWTYEEVKSAFEYLKLQVKGPDDKWTVGESCTYFGFFRHGIDAATQRRTAPVRTKYLTDDELQPFLDEWWNLPCDTAHDVKKIFRAVIAADREKNRG